MTTLVGSASFANNLVGPTSGQPRTAASVNGGLQSVLNNTVALAGGYGNYRFAVTTGGATFNSVVERLVYCSNSLGASGAVTCDFSANSNGAVKEVFFDSIDQGTVVTFKDAGTTFLTWTAPASYTDLSFMFLRQVNAWGLWYVSSPHPGLSEYDENEFGGMGGILAVTRDMRRVYIHDGDAGSIGSILRFRMDDERPGAVHEFTFSTMTSGALLIFQNSSGTEFYRFTPYGDAAERTKITVGYTRDTGWKCMGVSVDPQTVPQTLYINPAANASINPAIYRYVVVQLVSSEITLTLQDGQYYGQQLDICCRGVNNPSGRVNIAYGGGSEQLVLRPTESGSGKVSSQEKGAQFVWLQTDEGSRWHCIGASEQL